MGSAAFLLSPLAGKVQGSTARTSMRLRARRARRRRHALQIVAISYLIDSIILALYAYAGTIRPEIASAFAACGLGSIAIFLVLSETGVNDRLRDHYLLIPNALTGLVILLGFTYAAPQVGFLFLSNLFIVFAASSLRSTPSETAALWGLLTLGLGVIFLMTDVPIALPHNGLLERLATMSTLSATIGRCMFVGLYSNTLRHSLFMRSEQLKDAYKRIEELAELDELTGSFNRRCIMRMLDNEIASAQRSGTPCSVALIDLDWFKRINDIYGHPIGDEVLRTFAITMFANIREVDRFGRYGGEEFLLILPHTPGDAARRLLDRLRVIIAELDWSAFSQGMKVTISAGVITLQPGESSDAALARADRALYSAKAGGRNKIVNA